jgi:hypothetical protein
VVVFMGLMSVAGVAEVRGGSKVGRTRAAIVAVYKGGRTGMRTGGTCTSRGLPKLNGAAVVSMIAGVGFVVAITTTLAATEVGVGDGGDTRTAAGSGTGALRAAARLLPKMLLGNAKLKPLLMLRKKLKSVLNQLLPVEVAAGGSATAAG